MKKISLLAATLVAILFAASCQQENLEPVQAGSTVTFTVEVPEVATKGIGDDISNINNIAYAVYRTDDDNLESALQNWDKVVPFYQVDEKTTFPDGSTHVTLELVNDQKYVVLFWAQVENTWVPEKDFDLTNITYPAEPKANQADYAAFSGVAYLKKIEGSRAEKVTLTRPFAQINIAAKDPKHYDVNIATTKVTVSGAGRSFNVASQAVSETTDVVFAEMAKPTTEAFTVNEVTYDHYLAMNYVFANGNVDVTYVIDAGNHGIVENTVPAVPVKTNYRTNIVGNLLTSNVDYEVEILPGFADDATDEGPASEVFFVTTDEELEKALESDAEEINIILGADLDVTPSIMNAIGTTNVEKVIIDGAKSQTKAASEEGYTLNIASTYNAVVNAQNPDALIVLKNLNLNSSIGNGTWDLYDILFKTNVELENVNALKSIAFVGDNKTAVLKNVTITESHDYYALWISASGMNVEWEDGAINSEGRGIKIDDQYVDEPAATTLKVTGVDFNTKNKAAIMVKSSAETSIEVSDIDITGVAADPVNAVWVDEDAVETFDLVTVKGATKIPEGMNAEEVASGFFKVEDYYVVNTVAGLKAFAESVNAGTTYKDETVKLDADLDLQNELWTPIGPNADAAPKFAGTFDGQNRTISNLKVNTAKGYTAAGLFGSLNGTAKNFTIDGASVSHISTGAATDNGIAVVAGSIYNKGNIEGVTVLNATVNGNRYVGAIAGYVYGNIKNCTVKNVTLTATPDKETGSYDNGDKVGAIAGYFASKSESSEYKVLGNVVENATIVGYRDMGVVVGTAHGADAVYGNTVKGENFVTVDRNLYYGDKDDNTGEVVGRITAGTLGQNTVVGTVTITHPVASAEINAAIKDGGDYTFEEDVEGQASSSNGYGKTGIMQTNGGTIDGNGHTLEVPEASGTWDSAINTTGGTIKNLTIAAGFRGIFINHNSANCSKVYLENVVIDGPVYTISCDQGSDNGLEATGSTFNGWTSYAATLGAVKFTDCNFGEGAGYAFCRPYAPTEFVGCEFEAGYRMDPRADVTFVDCTLDGVALTAANVSELVTSNVKNVVSVDGSEQVAAGAWKDEEGNYTATTSAGIGEIIKAGVTTINLEKGIYVIPNSAQGKTLTIKGAGADTKIATNNETGSYEGCNYAFDGSTVTFENISINTPSTTYIGYARCKGTYKNCVINGTFTLYDKSVFEDCTFNVSGDVYNVWTWGAPEATFTRCTFNSDGKAMLLYGEVPSTKLTMTNCIFNDKGGLTAKKAAIEIGAHNSCKRELIVTNATVNGYEINDEGINTGTTLWANKNSMGKDILNVVVDGVDVY